MTKLWWRDQYLLTRDQIYVRKNRQKNRWIGDKTFAERKTFCGSTRICQQLVLWLNQHPLVSATRWVVRSFLSFTQSQMQIWCNELLRNETYGDRVCKEVVYSWSNGIKLLLEKRFGRRTDKSWLRSGAPSDGINTTLYFRSPIELRAINRIPQTHTTHLLQMWIPLSLHTYRHLPHVTRIG